MRKLLTVNEAKEIFAMANDAYFGGVLKKPRFITFRKRNTLAMYTYSWRTRGKGIYTIYVSAIYEIDVDEFVNIVVHEMVHIYVHQQYGPTFFVHGKRFKEMAKSLNQKYGLNVRLSLEADKFSPICHEQP